MLLNQPRKDSGSQSESVSSVTLRSGNALDADEQKHMVDRQQHIGAQDQARRVFCESPFLVDHNDRDGKDRQCGFCAEERGESPAIKDGLQDWIDFPGRSPDHVQSGQQSIHEGQKKDCDDDAPRAGIVDIDIRAYVLFPSSAAFSPSLPAE